MKGLGVEITGPLNTERFQGMLVNKHHQGVERGALHRGVKTTMVLSATHTPWLIKNSNRLRGSAPTRSQSALIPFAGRVWPPWWWCSPTAASEYVQLT